MIHFKPLSLGCSITQQQMADVGQRQKPGGRGVGWGPRPGREQLGVPGGQMGRGWGGQSWAELLVNQG